MSFALLRYPDVSYETEAEAVKASFELDAVLATQKSIEETLPDGTKNLVSVKELNERLLEAEIAKETEEPSTPPEKVLEGEEEKFEQEV